MNEIAMHLVGNVVNDVTLRFTKAGDPVASFRIAVGTRRFDRSEGRWVDGDTQFLTVSCWRELGANVLESVRKGMQVIVFGRMRSREVARPCGDASHSVRYYDVEATSVGIDLARGVSTFERVKRDSVIRQEQRAVDEAMGTAGTAA
jgi:single-strand DNA-binding protein